MSKFYYRKKGKKNLKKILRFTSLFIFLIGVSVSLYIFFPLISWQVFFSPVFASNNIKSPIPQTTVLTPEIIKSLISQTSNNLGVDYSNPDNWFPGFKPEKGSARVDFYNISIPKLNIKSAKVSAIDTNLDKNLVNYQGTAVPPDKGTSVVYGHSTLPQLFDPKNYKTIFATLHTLKIDDEIFVETEGVTYKYKIFNIIIVEPSDTSIFVQNFDNSYLILVTCTPPGTTWKRLIIKSKLEKI